MDSANARAIPGAVEALIAELEREHAWLSELRTDVARVEQRCGHLLNSADSALSALDTAGRRPVLARIRKLEIEGRSLGRPAKDRRREAIQHLQAEKGHGRITNAE